MEKVKRKNNRKAMPASRRGFTLVELIVAMFISTLIITVVVAAFASAFKSQKKAREMQRNIEDAKASLERMAKTIRMSSNIQRSPNKKSVFMYSKSSNECVQYKFENPFIKEKKCPSCNIKNPCTSEDNNGIRFDEDTDENCNNGTSTKDCSGEPSETIITAPIADAEFYVPKYSTIPGIDYPPIKRVTIRMQMIEDENARLQTTISARDYQNLVPSE